MPFSSHHAVSPGSAADFAEADALREAVGWAPGSWFFEPVMASDGILPVIRDSDGKLIAMGLGAAFGRCGFVGNMVVHPAHQRRGLGAMVFEYLLEWFESNGVTSIQLEATPEGLPLYERYGFKQRWTSCTGVLVSPPTDEETAQVSPVRPEDWPGIHRLAAYAYGDERGQLLEALAAHPGTVELAVLRSREGNVGAFGLRREDRIGPVCAWDFGEVEPLARALLAHSKPGTRVPVGSPVHREFWSRLGVEVEDYDVRMYLGDPPNDEPRALYAMLNGGIG